MKRIANWFTYPDSFAVALALLAFIFLAGADPSFAASSRSATPKADRVEIRINELHTALNITAAQEELWNNVAQVMRDNAKTMDTIIASRKNAKSMNAVEDFKSYGEIQDAQAAGIKKFTPVFETLYNSMSDDQKKNADVVFARRGPPKSKAKAKGK
ncbi:MAG: Spy/CpxP family protein refolding chaperone [Syntrophorhabdaceae bacterium]